MGDFETAVYHSPLPNWAWALPDPDPDYEPDWRFWEWAMPGGEDARIDGSNSTAASFEEAVNRVSQRVMIPIHGGGGLSYDFMGLSFVAPVNRENQPSTGSYDQDWDLQQILERSFLDEEGARHEPTSGLSEEAVDRHLTTRDHHHDSRVSDDICVVCQDSLSHEKIATLDCGHDFHADCIKPWLMRKNSCPLCKATGIHHH